MPELYAKSCLHVAAKPGYAVGGIVTKKNNPQDARGFGLIIIFMRIHEDRLDLTDNYHSPWLGGITGTVTDAGVRFAKWLDIPLDVQAAKIDLDTLDPGFDPQVVLVGDRVVGVVGPPLEQQGDGVAEGLRAGLDARLPLRPFRLVAVGRRFETEVCAFLGRGSRGRHG